MATKTDGWAAIARLPAVSCAGLTIELGVDHCRNDPGEIRRQWHWHLQLMRYGQRNRLVAVRMRVAAQ